MNQEEKIKMFKDVFAPKTGEKILFLIDTPHDDIKDNKKWADRRKMAKEWYQTFKEMGKKENFLVEFMEYKATGKENAIILPEILNKVRKVNLVIAMTEYSASSSLLPLCREKGSITRGASMPHVEKRMEKSAFKADYSKVKIYARTIKKLLDCSIGAEVEFSTGDTLYIDLRNRVAEEESGNCTKAGDVINFPSGEAWKVPYEATPDEIDKFGESKTEGILPVGYKKETIRYVVKNNKIIEIPGNSKKAEEMRTFFNENRSRRNIAELGIGCNPEAIITDNILEDEKVGLHIAYGTSSHCGGKVESDMHLDICYSKGCPVEGTKLTLIFKDGKKIDLIKNAILRYDILK
jgi:hypothetical protein